MKDICPIMSYRNGEFIECTEDCALYDINQRECAISRINGNTKKLEDVEFKLDAIANSIQQLDLTMKIRDN